MVIAQAQKIEVAGRHGRLHVPARAQGAARAAREQEGLDRTARALGERAEDRRQERRSRGRAGRHAGPAADATKQSAHDLRERAKAEPAVQDMLDVFGGEIEDVEEIR